MPEISLEAAQELHMKVLKIDGHNDTPVERVARGERPMDLKPRDEAYHCDIPRMKEGGYTCGFFIVGNGPSADIRVTTEQILEQVEKYPEDLMLVKSSGDVEKAHETGKIGAMMSIEGAGRWLSGELDALRLFYRLGIRSVGITHGEGGDEPTFLQGTKSTFGPCTPADREDQRKNAKGLTDFGKAVLAESNRLSLITDLAHINDKAFYEVLELSSLPVTMSHTAVFSQCPHYRCLTDDQIKALSQVGGVMGIAFCPGFIDVEDATIDRIVDHIVHIRDLVGIETVGIGTDYDGMGQTIPVVPDVTQLVELTRSMMARGLSEDEIRKVWGGNFLRLFKATIG